MDPIAVISVNINAERASLLFETDIGQEEIKELLTGKIHDGQRIHILANNLSDMDLYVRISYLIRELFPLSQITLISDNRAFLSGADSFNYLRQKNKVIRLGDHVEHQERIFDECAFLDQMSDYSLLCDHIISGEYENAGVLIPPGPELKQAAIAFIWACKERSYPDSNTGKELLDHIGLRYKNLREITSFSKKFSSICEEDYDWNQIFGRTPVIDIWQFIKNEDNDIRVRFDQKRDEICQRAFAAIETAIRELHSTSFMLSALDCNNESGLYMSLQSEIKDDSTYLREMNRETFHNLQDKEERARKERGGIWGRRQEALDDFLETTDFFLNQRYEIHRAAAIKEIFDRLLQWFRDHDVMHAKGECGHSLYIIFEENGLYESFSEYYFQTLRMKDFFTEDRLKAVRNRIVDRMREADGKILPVERRDGGIQQFTRSSAQIIPQDIACRFLQSISKIVVEMIADGAALRCVVIEKDRVVLRFFREIEDNSKDTYSIAAVLKELGFLERAALVPVMEKEYAIEDGMWQILIDNDLFRSDLKECLDRIKKITSRRDELLSKL